MTIAETIPTILGIYFGIGLVVALLFVTLGLTRADPATKGLKTSVRLLFLPGSMILWPLMLKLWLLPPRKET